MVSIAQDEMAHAELAWNVATWLDGKLSDDARDRVFQELRRAAENLLQQFQAEVPEPLVVFAGLPSAKQSVGLIEQMRATLWS